MKTKTIGRLAAASIAAMTAVSAISVSASAAFELNDAGTGVKSSSTVWKAQVDIGNGVLQPQYFTQKAAADAAAASGTSTEVSVTTVNSSKVWVSAGRVYASDPGSGASAYNVVGSSGTTDPAGSGSGSSAAYVRYPYAISSNVSYQGSSGKWYPNRESLYYANESYILNTKQLTTSFTYSDNKQMADAYGGSVYFDTSNGTYTTGSTATTVRISGVNDSFNDYLFNDNHYYDGYYYGTATVYKVGNIWYPTYSAAYSAAGNNASKITSSKSVQAAPYFSRTTGLFYSTYDSALAASSSSSDVLNTSYYYNYNNYYNYNGGYWYNGKYYYYNNRYNNLYDDPYYYYWNMLYGNKDKDDDTTSNSKDTTTATVGKRKGWTSVASYLKNLKSGSSVTVAMNNETSIPSSVTSALKGKNVTVKFTLKNGVVFTINGKDISSASSIDIATAYNTKMVPTKLVQAAYKKNDAVSTAQITIDNGAFGADADVTVKFATKRAGCGAKLYRYNSSRNTLTLVDTSKVQENGKCTFGGVDRGGNYVIVLY